MQGEQIIFYGGLFLFLKKKEALKVEFPGGSEVKASACNAGDLGSIPGSGRYPGEGNGTPPSTLAWRIPWTEEPGRLESMGSQRVGRD